MSGIIVRDDARELEHAFKVFSFQPLINAKDEEIAAPLLAEREIELAKSEIERVANNGMRGDEFAGFVADKLGEVRACINEHKDLFAPKFAVLLHAIVNNFEKDVNGFFDE